MADIKSLAEKLVNLSVKDVNELATILKDEYGIEPAAAAVVSSSSSSVGTESSEGAEEKSNFDIINPSFTINNNKKISVKAERGSFLSDKEILLENNVIFKSSQFKLETNRATYNKVNQSAESKENSKFNSEGTTITSEGFEITENGNIIFFSGKTKLNLEKK